MPTWKTLSPPWLKETLTVKALASPTWLRARLDQCQTGLSSPAGGLHLKPTLIRTTDPRMQQALSLVCPRIHPHDPVEGAATQQSAMYSPHMASLIADVVLQGGRVGASNCKRKRRYTPPFYSKRRYTPPYSSTSRGGRRGELLARRPDLVRRDEGA